MPIVIMKYRMMEIISELITSLTPRIKIAVKFSEDDPAAHRIPGNF